MYVDISAVDNQAKRIVSPKQITGSEAPSRARKVIRARDVIVSMTRPNLNAVAIVPEELDGQICSTGFGVIRTNGNALPEYIFKAVQTEDFIRQVSGAVSGALYPAITEDFLRSIKLPLPPLDEQRRIVEVLERAAGIRRRREQALDKARALIPALFLDMFGDPATNPKGWPIAKLGELGDLDRGRSRHRPRNDPALYGGKWPFIQTGDVANSNGVITQYTQTYNDKGVSQSKLWPRGTLCITIAANIGATGILSFEACFPDSVVGFAPSERVNTEYVQILLDFAQPMLEKSAPQLAQKNINLKILQSLPAPVPNISLQHVFAERVAEIRAIIARQEQSLDAARALERALMARLLG